MMHMSKLYICLGILTLSSYVGGGCGARRVRLANAPNAPAGATHAKWDGKRFTCPGGTWVWADEREAIAGSKTYVYCVPVREVQP